MHNARLSSVTGMIFTIRRNHGLEHATVHLLAEADRSRPLAGYSGPRGFYLIGRCTAEEIRAAAAQAEAVRYLHATRAIHQAEARAARNSVLASSLGVIHGLSRRFWYAYLDETGGFPENSEIHARTLAAIVAGDAEAAAASADRLVDHLEQLTRRALERRIVR